MLSFPNHRFVREPLAGDLRYREAEAFRVVHTLAVLKAERLFVNVAEQVE